MAEIINFKSSGNWNSFQDLEDASPASQTDHMTRAAETKIINFNASERLAALNRKLGSAALEELVA